MYVARAFTLSEHGVLSAATRPRWKVVRRLAPESSLRHSERLDLIDLVSRHLIWVVPAHRSTSIHTSIARCSSETRRLTSSTPPQLP